MLLSAASLSFSSPLNFRNETLKYITILNQTFMSSFLPKLFVSFSVKRLTTVFAVIFCIATGFLSTSAYGQCSSNTIAFNGSEPVYNGACNNNGYQTINGTASSSFNTPYRWEYSLNGGAYQTVSNNSNQTDLINCIKMILLQIFLVLTHI